MGGAISIPLLIAYQIIPVEDDRITIPIEEFVMGFSFMPKTPRYIVRHVEQVHKNIKQLSLDASLALNIDSIQSIIGTNRADIRIKGDIDGSNKPPVYKINITLGTDFDVDMHQDSKQSYFRFNTLPDYIAPYFNLSSEDMALFTKQWVSYTLPSPDTPARKELNTYEKETTPEQKERNAKIQAYIENTVLPHASMSEKEVEGEPVYAFRIPFTQEDIEALTRISSGKSKLNFYLPPFVHDYNENALAPLQ